MTGIVSVTTMPGFSDIEVSWDIWRTWNSGKKWQLTAYIRRGNGREWLNEMPLCDTSARKHVFPLHSVYGHF